MGIKGILRKSSLASYGQAIRDAPRETILNRHLLLSALVYALPGMPVSKYIRQLLEHHRWMAMLTVL
jgi:hypothetical protein